MPTPQTKQIGFRNHLNLDPVGSDVDLSADVVNFDAGALNRIMLDANAIGYDVTRQVHGAFNFLVNITFQNRTNAGLFTLFENYFQGNPPYWMSFEWWEDAGSAVGAGNLKWHFVNGTCGTIPGTPANWNTIGQTTMAVMFEDVATNDADDAAGVSIKDGSTVVTHIADAAPA